MSNILMLMVLDAMERGCTVRFVYMEMEASTDYEAMKELTNGPS